MVELTPFHEGAVVARLKGMHDPARILSASLEDFASIDWERGVLDALALDDEGRAAMLGEAMTELDFRARRWVKVPRVCASLASSVGFLLATVSLRVGLSGLVGAGGEAVETSVNAAVLGAVDVAAVGLAGAAVCVAIQHRARSLLSARLASATRLVEMLEGSFASPLAAGEGHGSVKLPKASEAHASPS